MPCLTRQTRKLTCGAKSPILIVGSAESRYPWGKAGRVSPGKTLFIGHSRLNQIWVGQSAWETPILLMGDLLIGGETPGASRSVELAESVTSPLTRRDCGISGIRDGKISTRVFTLNFVGFQCPVSNSGPSI